MDGQMRSQFTPKDATDLASLASSTQRNHIPALRLPARKATHLVTEGFHLTVLMTTALAHRAESATSA
jgi:hypothetical protein